MAQSQLDLYNKALGAVGMDYTIAAVGESSVPAATCQLWYDNARQVILRAAHWNSTKRFARLVQRKARDLSADWVAGDPEPGYAYSYDQPSDLLAARYLTTFEQFVVSYDTVNSKKTISANSGGTASTDAPVLCYTADITDPTLWEPDLYQGMAYGLASLIAQPLTGKQGKVAQTAELANQIITIARANSANEMWRILIQAPEALQARGYTYSVDNPFIYPYGSMFAGTGAPVV